MIIDLVPEFLAVLDARDRITAYHDYLLRHRAVLGAYWHNYVLDLDSPQAVEVIRSVVTADRRDLLRLVESHDVAAAASEAMARATEALEADTEIDCYLTVGVGGANASELVVGGRGVVVIALEHFTGVSNQETWSLGLSPDLLPLWIAHEAAHVVRYCSPRSRSELRRVIADSGGNYDAWDVPSRVTLRELMLNEGLAVHASRAVLPGRAEEEYFGFTRRQYRRLRELEASLLRLAEPDLDRTGLGLKLRWLTGGLALSARLVGARVLPERAGYYLGARMAEALLAQGGLAAAVRAHESEFIGAEARAGEAASA
ncbi:MAG TPA: DUF2268 domain-containing putative Zn-dependent protease [Gemmatimonadales bacterium]|nr:DUF2268 domain-containing putative Zn-dependent protease [Gemmatimonadales bacterium]